MIIVLLKLMMMRRKLMATLRMKWAICTLLTEKSVIDDNL